MTEPFEGERTGVAPGIDSDRHNLESLWATLSNTLHIITESRVAIADSLDLMKLIDGELGAGAKHVDRKLNPG